MSTTITQGREVTRPDTTPLGSSALDHAQAAGNVVTNDHFGLTNNAGLWPSYNCLDMTVPTALCPDPTETKVFAFADWVPAVEGAVYGGVQCNHVGLDKADMKSEVERVFRAAEGKGIEQLLLANRFVAYSGTERGSATVEWDAPVDLTGAATLTVVQAIGVLEGYAAALYAGVPTLHLPRALITLGSGLGALVERNGLIFTKSGSKVAAGGGYDSTDVPDGTFDLYATGEVYIERAGDIEVYQFPVVPGTQSTESDDLNQFNDNTMISMAERMVRVAVDCFVAKVTATAW